MKANRSYRRAVCALAVLACALAGAAIAGAAPLGTITEFTAVGSNIAQVRAGPDGNLWFTDRAGKIGQITTAGAITEFSVGLNPGSQPISLAVGPDGNLWFTDAGTTSGDRDDQPDDACDQPSSVRAERGQQAGSGSRWARTGTLVHRQGTTKAIGTIDPTTHAISEFSAGLNAGSAPQQGITTGPDGNIWFDDRGTTRAIGMINPTTHAISEFSSGLNAGSRPVQRSRSARTASSGSSTGHDGGDRDDQSGDARDQRVRQRRARQRHRDGSQSGRTATSGSPTRARARRSRRSTRPRTRSLSTATGLNAGSLPGGI